MTIDKSKITALQIKPGAIRQQHGMVIIMALVILLILSILGISSMSSSTLQERMASNTRDHHIAFQAAEVALRKAEREIEAGLDPPSSSQPSGANSFSTTCVDGLCNCFINTATCMSNTTAPNYWDDNTLQVWSNTDRHRTYSGLADVDTQPKYIIEFIAYIAASSGTLEPPKPGDPEMYRITALGFGKNSSSRVMLQATYKKQQ